MYKRKTKDVCKLMWNKEEIDTSKINELRKIYNFKKSDFILVFVGRIAEEKNIPFIMEAVSDLIKEKPNLKLLIIGDGPDKEKYENYASEIDAKDNIIFTGKVPWDDVPIYYALGQAFISASTTETQGLTIIEAMASSLPALCINDESFNGTVVDDLNGYLFNDKDECEKAILKLMNDKKKLEFLSKNARTSADTHSAKYFGEKVLDVYKTAIKNRKPGYRERIRNFFKGVTKWKK